ncbi:MAG: ankyrin repeat domain-containing protein [bacterium]
MKNFLKILLEKGEAMKIFIFTLILSFILISTGFTAESDKWTQLLYDSIRSDRYADRYGEDTVVDIDNIKLALANGANPNWITSRGGHKESIIEHYVYLVSKSNNPNITEKGIEAIKMLFEHKAKLQYCDDTILYFPIYSGKHEIVKILLEKGASATFWPAHEIDMGRGITPIEVATDRGHEKIIELLVNYGAKRLSEKDAIQRRFIEDVFFGTVSRLEELIKKGADVNTPNRQGETALLNILRNSSAYYYDSGAHKMVMYLLGIGADVNLKGKGILGVTLPLHEAIYSSHFLFKYKKGDTSSLYAEKILQELIKKGAFVSAQDKEGKTPLHIAAEYNHLYAARLLLESGSKVMPKDKSGKTPLDYAESAEMIKLLKEYGAKE